MKNYFFILFLILCNAKTKAQKEYNVLDWKSETTLNTWLLHQMKAQYDSRRTEFGKALKSKKAAEDYSRSIYQKFTRLIGAKPKMAPLIAAVSGTIQKDGYRIEKIIYESFPNHHITSNLYIPEGNRKFAAALLFCGHEDVSKATESYQKTAILLAKNGFVVLVVDPVSQSERLQLTDKNGKGLTRGGTTEHTLLNQSSNLLGASLPAYELWDNVRSLDYLLTRREVDQSKVVALGNSGGAIQTIYFSAFEKRVKAFAVCSYLATREKTFELMGAADGCAQIPEEGKLQLEMNDLLIASAPKPLLILAGRYDFIDYQGTLEAYGELKQFYKATGNADQVDLFTYDDGHGISKPKREAVVSWFRKWFYSDLRLVKEIDVETLTDKDLRVTDKGQVNLAFNNEVSINDYNIYLFGSLKASRSKFLTGSRAVIEKEIERLLNIFHKTDQIIIEQKGIVKGFAKQIFRRVGEIPIPVLIYKPELPKKVVVWFNEEGKHKVALDSTIITKYKAEDAIILLADIRGIGETKDRAADNDPKYYNQEYRTAMLSLHIGQPLVGQRVNDIHTILQVLKQQGNSLPIELHASGQLGLPALFATLFNPQIMKLILHDALHSYNLFLSNPATKDLYPSVIFGVLKYLDIPDIKKLIGEDRITYLETIEKI